MAEGRKQSRAIRDYLEALQQEAAGRRRGRKRTPESIQQRIQDIDATQLDNPLKQVELIQERIDLVNELARLNDAAVDPTEFEDGFVESVKSYSERKGISYAAWRELGVEAAVLKKAGVRRSS